MRFTRYLESECIPEWRKAYIDYPLLKSHLAQVRKSAMSHRGSPSVSSLSSHATNATNAKQGTADSSAVQATHDQQRLNVSSSPQAQSTMDAVMSHANKPERKFFHCLEGELEKVSNFYNEHEQSAQSKMAMLKQQMAMVDEYWHVLSALEVDENRASWQSKWDASLQWLRDTLQRRSPAHLENLDDGQNDFDSSTSSRSSSSSSSSLTGRNNSVKNHRRYFDSLPIPIHQAAQQHMSYETARNRLKTALIEFYHELELLESYKSTNELGFRRILKMFDQAAGWKGSELYFARLKKYHFMNSNYLGHLMLETENMFVKSFADGSREQAYQVLRSPDHYQAFGFTTWRIGVCIGASVIILIQTYLMIKDPATVIRLPSLHHHVQIYACFLLLILFCLGFSVNVIIWSQYRINYPFIFGLARDHLNYHQVAELPALMLLILAATMYVDFLGTWVPSNLCPILFVVICLGILLCPFDILYASTRRWFCISLGRVALSYLCRVEFRDFFIADELNSLSYSLWTMSYFFCAYTWHWDQLDIHCNITQMQMTPYLAALGPWWRLLQCIRRYQDSSDRVHLLNAAKYVSSILAMIATGYRRIADSSVLNVIWILACMVNSAYTSVWDLRMDWGLLQPSCQYYLLREELTFKPLTYYGAGVLNVILRFAWALNMGSLSWSDETLAFLAALLESYRRLQWNIFRVEYEHINNCTEYRANHTTPLPFGFEYSKDGDQETCAPLAGDVNRRPSTPASRHSHPRSRLLP